MCKISNCIFAKKPFSEKYLLFLKNLTSGKKIIALFMPCTVAGTHQIDWTSACVRDFNETGRFKSCEIRVNSVGSGRHQLENFAVKLSSPLCTGVSVFPSVVLRWIILCNVPNLILGLLPFPYYSAKLNKVPGTRVLLILLSHFYIT